MKHRHDVFAATSIACALIGAPAYADVTTDQLLQALNDARQAAATAQAAAEKAEAALAQMQAQQAQPKAQIQEKPQVQEKAQAQEKLLSLFSLPGNALPPQPDLDGFAITGIADLGYRQTENTADPSKNNKSLTNNNASTSLIFFEGQRRLTDYVKGSFLFELDFNPTMSSTANGPSSSNAFQGTPFGGEQWVAFTGDFGNLKLGTMNASAFIAGMAAQPFGTGIGGGYSPTFGRFGASAVSGISQYLGNTNGRIVRHQQTAMYTTPKFHGFSASGEYAFGNDKSTTVSSNSNGYKSGSLRYNEGPLNVVYSYATETAGAKAAAGMDTALGTTTASALPINTSVSWNIVGANYTIGDATIYSGYSTTKQSSPKPLEDSSSWNVAFKYVLAKDWALMANYLTRDSNIPTAPNVQFLGLGVNYYVTNNVNLYVRDEGAKYAAIKTAKSYTTNIFSTGVQFRF